MKEHSFEIKPIDEVMSHAIPTFKLEPWTQALEEMRGFAADSNAGRYPTLQRLAAHSRNATANVRVSRDPIPPELLEASVKMNQAIFGQNNAVELVFVDSEETFTDPYAKKLYFSKSMLRRINAAFPDPRLALDFIAAHEMSHYVYEYYMDHNKLTPHGNGSLVDHEYDISMPSEASSWHPESFDRLHDFQVLVPMARAHAEVDAIALATLLKAGYQKSDLAEVINTLFTTNILYDISLHIGKPILLSEYNHKTEWPSLMESRIRLGAANAILDVAPSKNH